MSKENKTSDKQQNGNDFIADVMLSCPFCGGEITEDNITDVDYGNTGWYGVQVKCRCGVAGKTFDANSGFKDSPYEKAKQNAIEAWNKRA